MDNVLQTRVYNFLQQGLLDQELRGPVLKKINEQTYKISNYRLNVRTAQVQDSLGNQLAFLNSTTATVYCCLMASNLINDAIIILELNNEIVRLTEKIHQAKSQLRRTKNSFTRDMTVARLLEFENQITAKNQQLKKNIINAKYIIKPGHANGS